MPVRGGPGAGRGTGARLASMAALLLAPRGRVEPNACVGRHEARAQDIAPIRCARMKHSAPACVRGARVRRVRCP